MKYEHILKAISETVWLIHPPKLEEIIGVVEARMAGIVLDADQFEAVNARRKQQLGRSGRIEVLGIHGTISQRPSLFSSGATSLQEFGRAFDAAVADGDVGGILLDVDSGGGSVFLVEETADKIHAARGTKPIVAVASPEAYSAGYWLPTAADEVWVQPSGMVGSVGVVSAHVDQSQWNEEQGLKVTYVTAGRYKVEGNPDEPLGEEARAEMQRHVDRYYRRFIDGLARNRGLSAETVDESFGQGRVFGAADAVRLGMADKIGTFEQALGSLASRVQQNDRMSLRRKRTAIYGGSPAGRPGQ